MGSTLESTTIPNLFGQDNPHINGNYPNHQNQHQQQQQQPAAAEQYASEGVVGPIMQWLWTEGPAQEWALVLVYSLILWTVYKLLVIKFNKWRASRSALGQKIKKLN